MLEGVAYNSRWLLEVAEKFVKQPFQHLNFIGGGAKSELWCQIHADVLDREIRRVAHPIRANARGAALLASIALGHCSVADLSTKVPIDATYRPRPELRDTYDALFATFRSLYKQNKRIYQRLNA